MFCSSTSKSAKHSGCHRKIAHCDLTQDHGDVTTRDVSTDVRSSTVTNGTNLNNNNPLVGMSHKVRMTVDLGLDSTSAGGKGGCEEPELSTEEHKEARHLKELLLLHLDLIQQQQELLHAKERQIRSLKQDKDALRCRLERMERRMSLLRQRGETPDKSSSPSQAGSGSLKQEAPNSVAKGIKRRGSLEPQNLSKRFETAPSALAGVNHVTADVQRDPHGGGDATPSGPPTGQRGGRPRSVHLGSSPTHPGRGSSPGPGPGRPPAVAAAAPVPTPAALLHYDSSGSDGPLSPRRTARTSAPESEDGGPGGPGGPGENGGGSGGGSVPGPGGFVRRVKEQQPGQGSRRRRRRRVAPCDEDIQLTDNLYYVSSQVQLPPDDISPVKARQPETVMVPTWRVRHVPTGYQLEGTENLTDEAFLKRHQKPEVDEKRRKRWDAQMVREQKMLERLQQSELSVNDPSSKDLTSFLPDPASAKYIEVADTVPVSAFGLPIPKLNPSDFNLPWFDLDRREKEAKNQSSRSRKK